MFYNCLSTDSYDRVVNVFFLVVVNANLRGFVAYILGTANPRLRGFNVYYFGV